MDTNKIIFFVEDDRDIFELIQSHLSSNSYSYRGFNNGNDFFNVLEKESQVPGLVLLDIMLPDIDGLEICKRLRRNKETENIPIIMLTARVEEIDKVLGLEIGADDYITKPFSLRELIARIKALLRRVDEFKIASKDKKDVLLIMNGRLKIDFARCQVFHQNKKMKLTTTEFKLITILAKNKDRVMSRKQILENIWGDNRYVLERTVDVHIRHIRAKLNEDADLIENLRGFGYKLSEP